MPLSELLWPGDRTIQATTGQQKTFIVLHRNVMELIKTEWQQGVPGFAYLLASLGTCSAVRSLSRLSPTTFQGNLLMKDEEKPHPGKAHTMKHDWDNECCHQFANFTLVSSLTQHFTWQRWIKCYFFKSRSQGTCHFHFLHHCNICFIITSNQQAIFSVFCSTLGLLTRGYQQLQDMVEMRGLQWAQEENKPAV